jgi:hypothetical protein
MNLSEMLLTLTELFLRNLDCAIPSRINAVDRWNHFIFTIRIQHPGIYVNYMSSVTGFLSFMAQVCEFGSIESFLSRASKIQPGFFNKLGERSTLSNSGYPSPPRPPNTSRKPRKKKNVWHG